MLYFRRIWNLSFTETPGLFGRDWGKNILSEKISGDSYEIQILKVTERFIYGGLKKLLWTNSKCEYSLETNMSKKEDFLFPMVMWSVYIQTQEQNALSFYGHPRLLSNGTPLNFHKWQSIMYSHA